MGQKFLEGNKLLQMVNKIQVQKVFGLVSCLPSAVTYCLQEIFVPSPEDELFYII